MSEAPGYRVSWSKEDGEWVATIDGRSISCLDFGPVAALQQLVDLEDWAEGRVSQKARYDSMARALGRHLTADGVGQVPTGWADVVADFLEVLDVQGVIGLLVRVKQNFGELRVYRAEGLSERAVTVFDAAVEMAELAAHRTCQECGAPGWEDVLPIGVRYVLCSIHRRFAWVALRTDYGYGPLYREIRAGDQYGLD